MVRRWYVVVVGLFLSAGLGWGAMGAVPAHYTARGLVMLLPSKDLLGARGNPLLNLGGLDLPARVLVAYYGSEPARSELATLAPNANVAVTIEQSTAGPIIAVDVADNNAQETLRVLDHVVGTIPENLTSIQASVGATGTAAIGSIPLVVDDATQRDYGVAIRVGIAAFLAGIVLTLLAAFAVDGLLLRRAVERGIDVRHGTEKEAVEDEPGTLTLASRA